MKCDLKSTKLVHILVIFSSVFIAYYPALDAGLVFDDRVAIVKNEDIRPNSSLTNLFKNDYWGTPLNSHLSHKSYRPLTTLTFRLNYLFHKLNPYGYHLVNLLLHAIASAFVYKLSLRILRSSKYSLLSGLLFALHPVHTDAVISVVGRAELLSSIFYLVGLLLITDRTLTVNLNSKQRFVGCIICSLMGFLCKEQSLMLLPLLICFILVGNLRICSRELVIPNLATNRSSCKLIFKLTSYVKIFDILISSILSTCHSNRLHKSYQLNQLNKKLRKRNKAIWLLVISFTIILLIRLNAHGRTLNVNFNVLDQIQFMNALETSYTTTFYDNKTIGSNTNALQFESLSAYLTSCYVIAFNFWLLFYPDRLACDWSFGSLAPVIHLSDTRNLFSIALLSLYIIPFLKFVNDTDRTKFKVLYIKLFLLMIVPFLPVILLKHGFVLAERVLYLPSIGFCILISFICENYMLDARTKIRTVLKIAFIVAICLMFSAIAIKCQVRSLEWRNEKSLLQATLRTHPQNVKMLTNMAKHLHSDGQIDEAITHYNQALSLHNGYLRAYRLLAELYYEQNQIDRTFSVLFKAREQVMLKLDSGEHIAQESMPILIKLEQLIRLHTPEHGQSVKRDIIKLYHHLEEPASNLNLDETYNLAIILKNELEIQNSIDLLKQTVENSQSIHNPSLELYNELLKPQQAVNHFRSAMKLLKQDPEARDVKLREQIRFHLNQCVFYDRRFIQAHYNLALLDYKLNILHQTRQHLSQVVSLQPNHFKANLMLCDLLLEDGNLSDQVLFEAVRCYTKLLKGDEDLDKKPERNLHEPKDQINSSDLSNSVRPYGSRTLNDESTKVFTLARHNLCSVLDLINSKAMHNPMNISTISTLCKTKSSLVPTNSVVQQIFFQIPITST